MVVVAVAGTGLVGTQVIRELLASGKHTVTILSRSPKPTLTAQGAIVKTVNYYSISSLVSALSESPEPVHTVISCIASGDRPEMLKSQLNLLEAAKQAGAKRFAPSEYGLRRAADRIMAVYRDVKDPVWRAAEESGLEVTAFTCGLFMNYLASGSSNPSARKELGGAERTFVFIVDFKKEKANIPGTGKELVTLTRWQDVGKFVAAAVELEKWEKELSMAGDVITYDEVVNIAEEVTGRKFEVVKHSMEDLRKDFDSETGMAKILTEGMLVVGSGLGYAEPRLNKIVDVKPMTVKEFITICWGK